MLVSPRRTLAFVAVALVSWIGPSSIPENNLLALIEQAGQELQTTVGEQLDLELRPEDFPTRPLPEQLPPPREYEHV